MKREPRLHPAPTPDVQAGVQADDPIDDRSLALAFLARRTVWEHLLEDLRHRPDDASAVSPPAHPVAA